jgi:hypothetical protein
LLPPTTPRRRHLQLHQRAALVVTLRQARRRPRRRPLRRSRRRAASPARLTRQQLQASLAPSRRAAQRSCPPSPAAASLARCCPLVSCRKAWRWAPRPRRLLSRVPPPRPLCPSAKHPWRAACPALPRPAAPRPAAAAFPAPARCQQLAVQSRVPRGPSLAPRPLVQPVPRRRAPPQAARRNSGPARPPHEPRPPPAHRLPPAAYLARGLWAPPLHRAVLQLPLLPPRRLRPLQLPHLPVVLPHLRWAAPGLPPRAARRR